MQPTALQKLRSYLHPVLLWKGSSPVNPVLELSLFRGRFQLATEDALYSDGAHYRPLVAAFRKLRPHLGSIRTALVLGAGLGSAVHVLKRLGATPQTTLVDLDPVVLQWAAGLMDEELRSRVRTVAADAQVFVAEDSAQYDLVVVDVFLGQEPAPFVVEEAFLEACRARLQPGGRFVLNYIERSLGAWAQARRKIAGHFPDHEVLHLGINKVVVGR